MQNPGSTTFWRHSYNLNFPGRRRGLASRFAHPGRFLGTLAAALLVITVASRASADEITRWNQIATDASTVADTNPLTEACDFAILHVAIHDAVNAVESRYEPYLPKTSSAPGVSVEAAIAGAAHATLVALLPGPGLFVQVAPTRGPPLGANCSLRALVSACDQCEATEKCQGFHGNLLSLGLLIESGLRITAAQ
jgi:hypothetical protein